MPYVNVGRENSGSIDSTMRTTAKENPSCSSMGIR